jgi:hypothetical protein
MSVVVNEFDVVPAPPTDESMPAVTPPEPPARLTPAALADLDRAMRVRTERQRRLEAY